MHLNQLYGYFGRRINLIETKNVYNKDLIKYYGSYTIFSEIKINKEITTLLMSSNFDYMFLIKVLFEKISVKGYFRENKVINIVYQNKNNDKSKIYLYDSLLMLPSSLRSLASKFKVESQKGFFPYSVVNEKILEFVGPTPPMSAFDGISEKEYNGLISNTWNFKVDLLKYLQVDLISLYQVISIFAKDIYNLDKIDITKLPTISSVAFKIFRAN